jgi:hypothetical protein
MNLLSCQNTILQLMPEVKRITDFSQSSVVTLLLLVSFVVICLFWSYRPHYFQDVIKIIFVSGDKRVGVCGDSSVNSFILKLSVYFVAFVTVSGFFILFERHFCGVSFNASRCWLFFGAVPVWLLFKCLTFKIWDATLTSDKAMEIFQNAYLTLFVFFGMALYPLLLLAVYAPPAWMTVVLSLMCIIICLWAFCVILKLFQIFFKQMNDLFYIFLYLCGLEIIPILLLRKLVFFYLNLYN